MEFAIFANDVAYLGSVFLSLCMLLTIVKLCGFEVKKGHVIGCVTLGAIMFAIIASFRLVIDERGATQHAGFNNRVHIPWDEVRSVTVARMTVPCCGGLEYAVYNALAESGKDIPLKVVTIGADGARLSEEETGK